MIHYSLKVREPRFSAFQTFLITHFATVSIFRDWFLRIGLRPRGLRVGSALSYALVQSTPNSVNFCLRHAMLTASCLWYETSLRSFNTEIRCASKKCLYFITNNLSSSSRYFTFYYWHFVIPQNQIPVLHCT
jgi:hypothetical protein